MQNIICIIYSRIKHIIFYLCFSKILILLTMENQESTFKLALKPGLIISGVSVAISLVLWATVSDLNLQKKIGYVTWLIVAFLYHYFTKLHRENNLGGAITYGSAFTFMFFMTIVTSIITMIYSYALFSYIDPSMVDTIRDQAAEKLYQQNNLTGDQIDKAIEMQNMWITPLVMAIFSFFGSIFFGTLLSLVVAIFVKKDEQIIEE